MRGILEPQVEKYLYSLVRPRGAVVREMERYAREHDVPIVGPACARVLYQMARAIGARRIFEMGSAIGYSTLWLARAAGPAGTVFYTDSDPRNLERAKSYLKRARLDRRVRFLLGDALEQLRASRGSFDIIFNDVNKLQYPEAFRLALPRLRRGGLLITDNVLWSGRVARPRAKGDQQTRAIQEFNRLIYGSQKLFTTIVPLRDGLAVSLKV